MRSGVSRDDPATYLARRFGTLYARLTPSTREDLERACQERGVRVYVEGKLLYDGLNLSGLARAIAFRTEPTPRERAHELFHDWLRENYSNGIDYPAPDWEQYPEEEAADRFALMVAGE